jgi:hypothetical protein
MCCALVLIGSRRMSDVRWDVNKKSRQIAYPSICLARLTQRRRTQTISADQ